jgi:hypothetical protein
MLGVSVIISVNICLISSLHMQFTPPREEEEDQETRHSNVDTHVMTHLYI